MRIQVEDVSVWALLSIFFLGACLGIAVSYSTAVNQLGAQAAEYEAQLKLFRETKSVTTKLLESATCPASVFQEKTIMLPDGGTYQCGAVRTIPVNQRELDKWYKAEARKLLNTKPKASGKKKATK